MASPYATPVEVRNKSRLTKKVREDDSDAQSIDDNTNNTSQAVGQKQDGAVGKVAQQANSRIITALWIAMPQTVFHSAYIILFLYAFGALAKKATGRNIFPPLGGGLMPAKLATGPSGASIASTAKYSEGLALFVCVLLAMIIDVIAIIIIYAVLNPVDTVIKFQT